MSKEHILLRKIAFAEDFYFNTKEKLMCAIVWINDDDYLVTEDFLSDKTIITDKNGKIRSHKFRLKDNIKIEFV